MPSYEDRSRLENWSSTRHAGLDWDELWRTLPISMGKAFGGQRPLEFDREPQGQPPHPFSHMAEQFQHLAAIHDEIRSPHQPAGRR